MIDLNLHAALPEIWIAVSAMVLLLIGAYVGDRAMRLIGLLSIAVMVVAIVMMLGIDVSTVPQLAFGGLFIVDTLRRVRQGAGPDRRHRLDLDVVLLRRARGHGAVRAAAADAAGDPRHDADGVGQRPHLALCRAGAAEPRALRHRRDPARHREVDRGGPQVLRPRRAVVGHAALRRLDDLRLRRHGQLRRPFDGAERRDAAVARPHRRPGVPVRGPRLQDLGGAVPYVDAGRLRGRADADHRLLRGRAEGRRHRAVHPRAGRCRSAA